LQFDSSRYGPAFNVQMACDHSEAATKMFKTSFRS